MPEKCIVSGAVIDNESKCNGFWCLNGDIEDVSRLVSEMPMQVQEYIATNKRMVTVKEEQQNE